MLKNKLFRFGKKTLVMSAIFVIVISVLLNATYFTINHIPHRNQWLSKLSSQLLQQPITIQQAHISGFSFLPRLDLQHVTITGQSPIRFSKLSIRFNLLKSVWQRQWVTDNVVVKHLQWTWDANSSGASDVFLQWAMTQPRILFDNMRVNGFLSIQQMNLLIENNAESHVATFSLGQVSVPSLFSRAFSNAVITGNATWNPSKQTIFIRRLVYVDPNLKAYAQAKILLQKNQSPSLSLVGDGYLDNVAVAHRYLPDRILPNTLVQWLSQGLKAGSLPNIRFLWRGLLSSFPFEQSDGHFEAVASIQHATLLFNPQWPAIHNINGEIRFNNEGFSVDATQAMLAGNPIQAVHVSMQDLEKPILLIDGTMHTPLNNALTLLQQSPLAFAKTLRTMQGSGDIDCHLNITLPLDFPDKMQNNGTIQFLNNQLLWPAWNMAIKNITGSATVNNNMLSAHQLTAQFLSQPITIRMDSQYSQMKIFLSGLLDMRMLQKKYDWSFLKILHGKTDFTAEWLVKNIDTVNRNVVDIVSNLRGISLVNAPDLFEKKSNELLHSHAHIDIDSKKISLLAKLGTRLSGAFQWEKKSTQLHWMSAHIRFGNSPANFSKEKGLWIDGHLAQLNVSRWQRWINENHWASSSRFVLPAFFRKLNITVDNVFFLTKQWKNMLLQMLPLSDGALLRLQNTNVTGDIIFPEKSNAPVQVNLRSLILTPDKNKKPETKEKIFNPKIIPALNIRIQQFQMGDHVNATVSLQTKPIADGLEIQQLHFQSPLMSLKGDGRWVMMNHRFETTLIGKMQASDLGALLQAHHWSSRLKNGDMTANFALSWPGSPEQFSLTRAVGRATLSVHNGRILHLDSETQSNLAFGQLLNLLSLESLSQLLTLHFSEFTKSGFVFDDLNGQFELGRGVLVAHQAEMNASVARIHFDGKIGLTDQPNDLMMSIYPKVSDSLPVLIGLAGGPIAGAAAWLVNKVVSPSVGHLMQMDYHITGTLKNPVVKRTH